ncbi:hypothetical protein AUEXF2481DRAFT_28187 [Aureobasidium subglaciale EXF-2481]|uniref:Zn(2)-C6 fungal-type domain-containing protein n=1 Tax=Aureobasidium subglaciale (strain EXF-2481) TaxID=1043005 RepID=A0A074YH77_AURSE|nr:uncharacterized protein AUEXF2481DRAFT_28187 [Aureobasidium subglaciale EXF-2481]KAI5200001.1 hypothetical protein E4T38_06735 [Aureobasidium subglaciale]KAI5222431.1 hypothetical protein E4T41_06586 [Aureobasidium subglaciale]KAI5223349.1 hypothetical protein E4T40_04502 [Aureobasidium subglaciale]KAI5259957.1 hypothetical protein E4T46_06473 [Aureobasidium subglaciale]KEQ97075.1 hypothetical protein AUEXF2481DRAFT_28187 [Aureobasidium subglaciale EXF-2481]
MSQAVADQPRKRRRVTQACHRCRSKKYKCDSVRPTCSTCQASDAECIYGTVVKRRGLQSGYVRALEILWGLVFKNIEGSQNVATQLLANLAVVINPVATGTSDNDRADDLLESWRGSGVPTAIESLLDGEVSESPRLQNGSSGNAAGLAAWSLPQPDPLVAGTPPSPASPLPPPQFTPPPIHAVVVPDATYLLEDIEARRATQELWTPLPSDWHALTQVYSTVEHSWFPVLERHALFRVAYTYQDQCDSRAVLIDRHRGDFATLWAVLTLGEIHSGGVSSPRATQFQALSRSFLPVDYLNDDYLSHAQALLLWAVIHLGRSEKMLAKMALAQATVLCSVDTHKTTSNLAMSERQRNLLLAGCFVIDSLLSFSTGTKPRSTIEELPTTAPCDASGPDEWEPFVDRFGPQSFSSSTSSSTLAVPSRASSTFNCLVRLTSILNAAVHRHMPGAALAATLETWTMSLPTHLAMTVSSIRSTTKNLLPPQLHLRAIYFATTSVITSRQSNGQNINSSARDQLNGALHQLSHNFGVRALPASVSVLIPIIGTLPPASSEGWSQYSVLPHGSEVLAEYKSLWGWINNPSSPKFDAHATANFLSHESSYRPTISETTHDLGEVYNFDTDTGEHNRHIMVSDLDTSEQLDVNIFSTTPDQFRDYLALLEQNESTGNGQDFMQSLGFFEDFDYRDM